MRTTSQELEQVAAAEKPRHDLYSGIHKALRAFMADTLLAVGRMDCEDRGEVADVSTRVLELLGICAAHLTHEDAFVHAAIEARAPGASDVIAREHEEHAARITDLGRQVATLQCADPVRRPAAAQQLYRNLALFVAENFQHMHVEETAHNAVLCAHYSDAELVAIHDALVAAIPPEEMMAVSRWLVPSMNPAERANLLADLRAKAPAPAFEAILGTVQPHLSTAEWAKLARALALPPVPGLVTD